jgi:hypothetical protein
MNIFPVLSDEVIELNFLNPIPNDLDHLKGIIIKIKEIFATTGREIKINSSTWTGSIDDFLASFVHEEENGDFPLLVATRNNGLTQVREILLRQFISVNYENKNDQTALSTAIMNNNREIVNILLLHGANSFKVNKNGLCPAIMSCSKEIREAIGLNFWTTLSFYKTYRPDVYKQIKQKVPIVRNIYKEITARNLITHTCEIRGSGEIHLPGIGKYIGNTEGYFPNLQIINMLKFLNEFEKYFPKNIPKALIRSLQLGCFDPKTVLEHYAEGESITFLAGWKLHGIVIQIINDLLVICNRGDGSSTPFLHLPFFSINAYQSLQVMHFTPEKLSESLISKIQTTASSGNREDFHELLTTLVRDLECRQTPAELYIQESGNLGIQTVGNCSLACLEGGVYSYLIIDALKKTPFFST